MQHLQKTGGEGLAHSHSPPSHLRGVHVHGDRSLDQLQRDDHPQMALLTLQHPFESCERSPGYPHAPPHCQERMWLRVRTLQKPRLQDFHFRIRQSRRQSAKADQANDARNLHNAHPVAQRQPDENVSGKQCKLQLHPTVFPAPHGTVQWKKILDASRHQLSRDALLMLCTRVRRVPMRFNKGIRQGESVGVAALLRSPGVTMDKLICYTPYTASPPQLQMRI